MRVTDNHMFSLTKGNVMAARTRLANLQRQAMDGTRVAKPSDDPLAASQARREVFREKRAESYERTINTGLAALQLADAALDQVGAALTRVKELAIQASNDTISANDRAAMAREVQGLRAIIEEAANAEHGGRHVFAGFLDGTPPFDVSGLYSGGPDERQLEVAPGVRLRTTMTGDRIFAPPGGTDIFADVSALDTALSTNDEATIRASLGGLDAAIAQIADARAEMGSRARSFQTAYSVNDRTSLSAMETREKLIGADPIDSFSELTQAQHALSTAIQIASQLPPTGLVGRG